MNISVMDSPEPWDRLVRGETVGGINLDLLHGTPQETLRPFVDGYTDELMTHAVHNILNTNTKEINAELQSMIRLVSSWSGVGDIDADADPNLAIRLPASYGLCLMHEAVSRMLETGVDVQSLLLWDRMVDAAREATVHFWFQMAENGSLIRSQSARKAAIARHDRGPFSEIKAFTKDLLKAWDAEPDRYKSIASFARDVVDKFPVVANPVTIERWVRTWRNDQL